MSALEEAKKAAFPPGQYVAQESFVSADEILWLARTAGLDSSSRVLDMCCGIGGPARHIVENTGCRLVGVDREETSIGEARRRAKERDLVVQFEVAEAPPAWDRKFDAVLLVETVLAFRDKRSLVRAVWELLENGGSFLLTLEEGDPLSPEEARLMPRSDTVWLASLGDFIALLNECGFAIRGWNEFTTAHQKIASSLADEYQRSSHKIAEEIGRSNLSSLLESHRLWSAWMEKGRVRKYGIVATKD